MPRAERAWVPRLVPVKEAMERTLRVEVVMIRSLGLNLATGTEEKEEEDWATLELEEDWTDEDDWVTEEELEDIDAEEDDTADVAVVMIYPTPLTCPLVESVGMTMFEFSFSCLPEEVSVMVKLEAQSPDSMK